ncbi:hypothetical protein T03_8017 [Trichinella britovi]|uniref:Uncharacterized protein n=1 Tax=Trichinella britovi TaxID=45882 RepID=A0A0V1D7K5_TRIBR|nr:hypothetical protein T03_8017 [Trichinella britovi]
MIELLVLTLSGKMVMFSKNTNSNLSDSFVNYLETVDLGRFCKCFLVDKIENCHSVLPMYLQERTVSLSRVRSPDSVYALYKQVSHCALLKRDHGNLPYAAANCSSKLCREAVNTIRQSIVRLYDRDEDLLHCCANER